MSSPEEASPSGQSIATPAPTISIDIGTTKSCAAVFQDGKVEVILNEKGNKTTPSFFAILNEEHIVGEAAKSDVFNNFSNTRFYAIRMLGKRWNDPDLDGDKETMYLPYRVLNQAGLVAVLLRDKKNERRFFTPNQIHSELMMKMQETAAAYLKKPVTDAVITVPAYFDKQQRHHAKVAGQIAERITEINDKSRAFNAKAIIDEPVAVALALGQVKQLVQGQKLLIYDQGGGSLSVSVLSVADKGFDILSSAVDVHLAGNDFDYRLMKHFYCEFEKKYSKHVEYCPMAFYKLKTACEEAKLTLSSSSVASVNIDSLYEGHDFSSEITRAEFEELCEDQFRGTLETVRLALKAAELESSAIDEVVLVGGSSRMPKIRKLLEEFFDGKELNLQLNAEEAVAVGAAIHAATLDAHKQADECKGGERQDTADKDRKGNAEPTIVHHRIGPVDMRSVFPALDKHSTSLLWLVQNLVDDVTRTSITERLEVYHRCAGLLSQLTRDSDDPRVGQRCSDLLRKLRAKYGDAADAFHDVTAFPGRVGTSVKDRVTEYVEEIFRSLTAAFDQVSEADRRKVTDMGKDLVRWMRDNPYQGTLQLMERIRKLQRLCEEVGMDVPSDDVTKGGPYPRRTLTSESEERRQENGTPSLEEVF